MGEPTPVRGEDVVIAIADAIHAYGGSEQITKAVALLEVYIQAKVSEGISLWEYGAKREYAELSEEVPVGGVES